MLDVPDFRCRKSNNGLGSGFGDGTGCIHGKPPFYQDGANNCCPIQDTPLFSLQSASISDFSPGLWNVRVRCLLFCIFCVCLLVDLWMSKKLFLDFNVPGLL